VQVRVLTTDGFRASIPMRVDVTNDLVFSALDHTGAISPPFRLAVRHRP
jgi:hypothetical protein